MVADDTQKILDSIKNLEQGVEKGFLEVREEMQGGFAVTHERIAQSEQNIRHILESMVELHDSLDKRVEKLEEEIGSSRTH